MSDCEIQVSVSLTHSLKPSDYPIKVRTHDVGEAISFYGGFMEDGKMYGCLIAYSPPISRDYFYEHIYGYLTARELLEWINKQWSTHNVYTNS